MRLPNRPRLPKSALISEALESRDLLTGDFVSALTLGGGATDQINGSIVDSLGNTFITGSYSGTVDFDPGAGTFNLTSLDTQDAFLAKYDAAGNLVWAGSFGSNLGDRGYAVTLDNVGNVYVTGSYFNSPFFPGPPFMPFVDMDPGAGIVDLPSNTLNEVFTSKFDSDGNLIWSKAFTGSDFTDEGRGIAVDAIGNVHVTGVFQNIVDFDPTPQAFRLLSNLNDTFIAKLNSRGELTWAKSFTGIFFSTDVVENLGLDSFGNIYLSGTFTGSVDFDPSVFSNVLSSVFGDDVFVVKLDLSGVLQWARSFGDDFNDRGKGMYVDSLGNVLLAGSFRGFMDADPGAGFFELASAGLDDAFLISLTSAGNFVWGKSFGGAGNDSANAVTKDTNNNVYLTGQFSGTGDFNPNSGVTSLTSNGGFDVFVARLDNAANFSWAKSFGGSQDDSGTEIGLDSLGFIYVGGTFRATADFDPGSGTFNQTSNGGADIFRSRLTQELVFNISGIGTDDIVLRRNGDLLEIFDRNLGVVVEQRILNQILGVQIFGQVGEVDNITVDFAYGGTFQTIHPLVFSGNAGDGDTFNYIGTTREVTVYRPSATISGASRFTWDGKLFLLFGMDNLNLTRARSFRLATQGSTDDLTVTPSSGFGGVNATRINGTSSSVSIGNVTFDNVAYFVIDTGTRDAGGSAANDNVSIDENALKAVGLFDVNVTTGRGNDVLSINTPDLLFPVLGGIFRYRAGADFDRLLAAGDADWRLNDSRLVSSIGDGRLFFIELEKAEITGGAGNNSLIASGFSGQVVLDGGQGDDILRGGSGNDILIGGEGNDSVAGNGGADQYFYTATNGNDDVRLGVLTPTDLVLTRRNVGSATTLETDDYFIDASDRFHIFLLNGDDLLVVDLLTPIPGNVDGGAGTDLYSVPGNWTTSN